MNNQILAEMLVHVPLCSHPNPSSVLVVTKSTEAIKNELAKHKNTDVNFATNIASILGNEAKSYDVIIIEEESLDALSLVNLNNMLKTDGILVSPSSNYKNNLSALQNDLTLVGKYFWIAMPFNVENHCFIFSSKKYHPQADIILDKADLIDELVYYTNEMHLASFIFPAASHKALTGFAKR